MISTSFLKNKNKKIIFNIWNSQNLMLIIKHRDSSAWGKCRLSFIPLVLTPQNDFNPFRILYKHSGHQHPGLPQRWPRSGPTCPSSILHGEYILLLSSPVCFPHNQKQQSFWWVCFLILLISSFICTNWNVLSLALCWPHSRPGLILNWYLTGYNVAGLPISPRGRSIL